MSIHLHYRHINNIPKSTIWSRTTIDVLSTGQQHTAHVLSRGSRAGAASLRSKNARRHSARWWLVSSNCMPVPAPSDIVSVASILKKSSNRLSSLNCWRLTCPLTLPFLDALRAANDFKTAARARSVRMRRTSRLLQAVTMRATRGVERIVLIGVASLLHAKATDANPPYKGSGPYGAQVESNMLNYDLTPAKWASGNSTMRFSVEN